MIIDTEPRDFQRICMDLNKFYALTTIARMIGCNGSTPGNLYRGDVKQPRHDTGEKLIELLDRLNATQRNKES